MQIWLKKRLNLKVLLMSLLINMFAIGITALVLPGLELIDKRVWVLALIAVALGLLNTFVKPIMQLLTIRLLFVTYGLVLIITNTVVLLLLGWIFPNRIQLDGLLPAIVGGIMIGLISMFLDDVFGVNPPLAYQTDVEISETRENPT